MVTLVQEREDHLAREARGLPCHGQRALLQTFSAPVAARRTDGGCRGLLSETWENGAKNDGGQKCGFECIASLFEIDPVEFIYQNQNDIE